MSRGKEKRLERIREREGKRQNEEETQSGSEKERRKQRERGLLDIEAEEEESERGPNKKKEIISMHIRGRKEYRERGLLLFIPLAELPTLL